MKAFSSTTLEHIGCYVYALVDPSQNNVFYIGKGSGNRVFDHARDALNSNIVTPNDKLEIIRKIINRGDKVHPLILRHGLTEKEALLAESVLIDVFTNPILKCRRKSIKLANKQAGHDMRELGIRTAMELEAQYGSTSLGPVSDPVVVININHTYHSNINIYNATRFCWRLNKKRADKAKYILSEYQGVVRAVFEMDDKKWQPVSVAGKSHPRYFFTGHEVKSPVVLAQYLNKRIIKKPGASNPIKYINIK